jgi:hypothetical protein
MDSTIDIRHWLETKQAALQLDKSTVTITRMAKDGRLRGVIYGGGSKRRRLRIDPLSVTEFLAREKAPIPGEFCEHSNVRSKAGGQG